MAQIKAIVPSATAITILRPTVAVTAEIPYSLLCWTVGVNTALRLVLDLDRSLLSLRSIPRRAGKTADRNGGNTGMVRAAKPVGGAAPVDTGPSMADLHGMTCRRTKLKSSKKAPA